MSDSQSRSACTPAIAQLACIIFIKISILPSSCRTELLLLNLNSSMQFFHISHTTLWPLPSPVVNVIVKCHCITNDVVTNQVMVLPPQFNISSSPHCPFSLNFIQSTTQKFFVVNVISQTLSHFIIAFLSQIRFHVQNSSTQPHGACHTVGQNQTPQCSFSILLHLYFHPFQL